MENLRMTKPTVAVIGASSDRSKYGNRAVRAYVKQGYQVFPVNPKEEMVEGVPAYRSVLDIPHAIDRATLYLPPQIGIKILPEIAQRAPGEFFVNPGAESEELLAAAADLGLKPILACSILDIGMSPSGVDE